MQQKKEESQIAEETTTSFLRSIARRYQYTTTDTEKILAQFVDDVQSGYCLCCGLVHGFTNIDEARNRRQQQQNKTHNNKDLAHLFWEAAL
jgi:hypothetical protein